MCNVSVHHGTEENAIHDLANVKPDVQRRPSCFSAHRRLAIFPQPTLAFSAGVYHAITFVALVTPKLALAHCESNFRRTVVVTPGRRTVPVITIAVCVLHP